MLQAPKYGQDNPQWLTAHSETGAYGLHSNFNEGHLQTRITPNGDLPEFVQKRVTPALVGMRRSSIALFFPFFCIYT